jgi:hypothetical protein
LLAAAGCWRRRRHSKLRFPVAYSRSRADPLARS